MLTAPTRMESGEGISEASLIPVFFESHAASANTFIRASPRVILKPTL
ncbi:hypothetical protein Zm00014a_003923 [Zea mays]|uniref:Uncharacterized protein n=1 Tax=Zea mays TaxID=4577 RepID=A0A3L6FB71_MAIZE|nr:hypothetical protein Zm00014a_003923 [Zea mays]